jgi:hypothetical protein
LGTGCLTATFPPYVHTIRRPKSLPQESDKVLGGASIRDQVDRGSVDEVVAVLSRFLLERIDENLEIGFRDLAEEGSGLIVVQIDHRSSPFVAFSSELFGKSLI